MTDTKDKSDKSGEDLFSDGSELFETLFKEAPLEMEEEKKPKPAPGVKKEVKPAPELRRRVREQPRQPASPGRGAPSARQAVKPAIDSGPPARPVERPKAAAVQRPEPPPPEDPDKASRFSDLDFLGGRTVATDKGTMVLKSKPQNPRGGKDSKTLKVVLLLLVLGIGALVAASSLGFLDFSRYLGRPSDKKVQPSTPQAAKPKAEKKTPAPVQAKPSTQKPIPQAPPPKPAALPESPKPQPPASQQAAAPVKDKLAEIETPVQTALKQPEQIPAKSETQAPASSTQPKAAQGRPTTPAVGQTPVPSTKETLPPPRTAAPQPAPVSQSPAKAVPSPSRAEQPPPLEPTHLSPYPFSVYLGAFMSLDRARTAVSIYKKDYGLHSYWVKVDLGEKGTWYRVFTGYFQTSEEAEAFIRRRQLQEGEVKQTKYSTLIGVFSSQAEGEAMVKRLLDLGYASYFVPVPGGRFKLFSGAFYTLVGAQQQSAELASKGIKSEVVER